ncbi:hypothetical protein ACQPZG_02500 (plasmid) [Streptomyces sp. CA-294286]|uniref:hypothetical protein n=1 Tax=Streptomyces sp. CA-294286 TaxID=3240070 RepID=UPI003D8C5AF4
MSRRVPWRETGLLVLVCWVVTALGYAVLSALDEQGLAVAPPLVMGLAQWFWARHRIWSAAAAATVVGAVGWVFVDLLRPVVDRYLADALATALGATAALLVFALVSRVPVRSGRRRGTGPRPHAEHAGPLAAVGPGDSDTGHPVQEASACARSTSSPTPRRRITSKGSSAGGTTRS